MTGERLLRLALLPAGIAFGAVTVAIGRAEPGYSLVGGSAGRAALELVAGLALLGVGLVAWGRRPSRRFGALLVAASFGWYLVEWNNPGVRSPLVFALGLALYAVAPPLVSQAALAYPDGRLSSRLDRFGLVAAYAGGVVVLGLASSFAYDPRAAGCGECPRNLLLVHHAPRVYEELNRLGVQAGLAWSLLLIALCGVRFARSTPALRRVVGPVLVPASCYLALVAWDYAHSLDRGALGADSTDRSLWAGEGAALAVLALGVVSSWLRARRTRGEVARLVVELANSPAAGGLRERLAETLRDPSLELAYRLGDGRLVDPAGLRIAPAGELTPLVRGGREVALLSHRAGLFDDPGLVEEVASAARLALENERLQAEARARLEDLRASRARVIAAGDAERRRLERDLHDGAQQRLVGLSLALRLARTDLEPADVARLDEADAELRAALAELRELAHGIFPAVLADEGLAAAVEVLAEEAAVPFRITALPAERFAAPIEATAYFVVAESLRRSRTSSLQVAVTRADGRLTIEVETDTAPSDLVDLEDRVGALDGTLAVAREVGGRVRIHAEIPCEL